MTPTSQRQAAIAEPKTRAELDALVAQRGELQAQLRSAEDRRTTLAAQASVTPAEQRGLLTQRIAALDERIERLESQIERLDEAIARGIANPAIVGEGGGPVMALPSVPAVPPVLHEPGGITLEPPDGPPAIHPEIIISGGLLTLSLMVLVAWVTWRRAVARFGRLGGSAAGGTVAPAADVARLQQSVDTMALEIERISENQRFLTKVLSQQAPEQIGGGRERG